MELTDAEIIERVLDGDTDSFGLLVERYSSRVYGLVSRVADSAEEPADIVQEVFVKAFLRLDRFEGRSNFGTWLYTLVYRHIIDRHRSFSDRISTMDETALAAISDGAVDALLESDDPRLAALPEALERLSAGDRALITLYYYEGLPLAEIARVTGLTVPNVKVRLHRIRKQLYVLINEISSRI